MNEFEDIDRGLAAAFTERPSALSRPSLRDVQRRARRHQRQRSAGILSACALVGVGGVAVLAKPAATNETTVGEGLETPTTSVAICFSSTEPTVSTIEVLDSAVQPFDSSSVPQTTVFNTLPPTTFDATAPPTAATFYRVEPIDCSAISAAPSGPYRCAGEPAQADDGWWYFDYCEPVGAYPIIPATPIPDFYICSTYVLEAGDFPGSVADKFKVTVEGLDAANQDTNGYGEWAVGTEIEIPCAQQFSTTTSVESQFELIKIGTAIQVFNCSNQEGVAWLMSRALAEEGFTMVEVDTGTIDLPVTKVIYNPDDPAALAVAQTVAFFLGNAVVEASGPVVPGLMTGTWAPGSSVIVLLGDDLAGKSLAQIAGGTTSATTTTYSP